MAIKIALKGQFFQNEPSNTNHVFPPSPDAWANELESETGKVMQSLNISGADKDCYTIVMTSEGVIYAYRRLLPHRGDCAMVMLMADGPARDGGQLKESLKKFLEYGQKAESSSKIDDNIIVEELKKINNLFHQGRKPMAASDTGDNATKKEAYRTFKTEEDLHRILEYPYQSAYEKYKCIHIVSEDYNPTPMTGGNLERIEDPVKRILFFKLPDDVSVKGDKQYVSENDCFVLQYSRTGCKTEEVYISTPFVTDKHFNVSDDIIEVKSAEECKISFKRTISVTVTDQHGNPISKWSYKIKGGNTAWRQQMGNTASIELEATEDTLLLKAEGYENPEEIIIRKNASSFAIKLKSKGICKNVYFEPVWKKKGKGKEESSVNFSVNVSAETPNVPLFQTFSDEFNNPNAYPTLYVMRKSPLPLMLWIGIIALLIGMGLGCVGGHFVWPKDIPQPTDSTSVKPTGPGTAEQGEVTPETPSTSPEDEEKKKEAADEEYLSNSDTWEKASIQSKKYQELFDKLVMAGTPTKLNTTQDTPQNVTYWWTKNNEYDLGIEKGSESSYKINNKNWNTFEDIIKDHKNNTGEAKKYRNKFITDKNKIDWKTVNKPSGNKPPQSNGNEQLPEPGQ